MAGAILAGERLGWRLGKVEELGRCSHKESKHGGRRKEIEGRGGGGLLCSSTGSTGKKRVEWE